MRAEYKKNLRLPFRWLFKTANGYPDLLYNNVAHIYASCWYTRNAHYVFISAEETSALYALAHDLSGLKRDIVGCGLGGVFGFVIPM